MGQRKHGLAVFSRRPDRAGTLLGDMAKPTRHFHLPSDGVQCSPGRLQAEASTGKTLEQSALQGPWKWRGRHAPQPKRRNVLSHPCNLQFQEVQVGTSVCGPIRRHQVPVLSAWNGPHRYVVYHARHQSQDRIASGHVPQASATSWRAYMRVTQRHSRLHQLRGTEGDSPTGLLCALAHGFIRAVSLFPPKTCMGRQPSVPVPRIYLRSRGSDVGLAGGDADQRPRIPGSKRTNRTACDTLPHRPVRNDEI